MNETTSSNADAINALREHINSRLVGQTQVVDQVLIALLAGGHLLLEDVPGVDANLGGLDTPGACVAVDVREQRVRHDHEGGPLVLAGRHAREDQDHAGDDRSTQDVRQVGARA